MIILPSLSVLPVKINSSFSVYISNVVLGITSPLTRSVLVISIVAFFKRLVNSRVLKTTAVLLSFSVSSTKCSVLSRT